MHTILSTNFIQSILLLLVHVLVVQSSKGEDEHYYLFVLNLQAKKVYLYHVEVMDYRLHIYVAFYGERLDL